MSSPGALRVLFTLLVLTPAAPLGADTAPRLPLEDYVRRQWTTADGLPQNSIRAIVQTEAGYLWLATSEGLARFDGARVTVLDRQTLPGLPSPNIVALELGRDGSIWLAMKRDGLVRLRGAGVERWTKADGLLSDTTYDVVEGADGAIWVCTDRGLSRVDPASRGVASHALPSERGCRDLATGQQGALWVATSHGLLKLAVSGELIASFVEGLPAPVVRTVLTARDGSVWAGTDRGVAHMVDGRFQTVAHELAGLIISALAEDRSGAIWIGTLGGGLARYAEGRVERLLADQPGTQSVLSLFEDREATMWAGLSTDGLLQLRATPFSAVDSRHGLPADVVRAVLPARDGSLWTGTAGSGLAHYKDGLVRRWTTREGLPSDFIFSMLESLDGRLHVGTREGLAVITGGRIESVNRSLPGAIRALGFGRDGLVRAGTREGVYISDARGSFSRIGGTSGVVRALHERADGAFWVASLSGLQLVTTEGVRTWTEQDGLPDSDLSALHENPDGSLWVATLGQGLFHFDGERATRYTTAQGLFDDTIFQMVADNRGWLWMTSNRGLFRVRLADLEHLRTGALARLDSPFYAMADGLPANEFNGGATPGAARAPDGALWFASIRGALRVDTRRVVDDEPAPDAIVEALVMDGAPRPVDKPLVVPPGPSRVEVHYGAATLIGAEQLRFRYRLEGFDADWVDAGARRVAYYTNLPPGTYRFQLMASRNGFVWSPPSAALQVTLEPLFYQTPWFSGVVMAVTLLATFAGLRLQERRRAARERRLEALVASRTEQLEAEIAERRRAAEALELARAQAQQASELKSQFLANVSHEIRTPMNGVIGMTDLALDQPLPAEARRHLEIARSSADLLLQVINDVLDFSKIEAGKLDFHPVAFDLRDMVHGVAALLAPRAEAQRLELGVDVDPDVPHGVTGDPVRLRQVLLNLVSNAVKFTERGGVSLSLSIDEAAARDPGHVALRFAVRDTGVGIAPDDQVRVFDAFTQVDGSSTRRHGGTGLGLAIAARLVDLMGGRLRVESTPGVGSTFSFTVALLRAETLRREQVVERVYTPPPASLRVLVAEDNPVNCLVVRHMLARSGHEVAIAANGREAVAAALGGGFDVVLMDVQMPEMNGIEATETIRAAETGLRLPIIGLTAHALRGDRERCLAAGMDDFLAKPIRRADLDRALLAIAARAA